MQSIHQTTSFGKIEPDILTYDFDNIHFLYLDQECHTHNGAYAYISEA